MSAAGTENMAKKRTTPEQWQSKPIVVQLRGTPEFKAWVEGLADFDATNVSELTERALAAYARQIRYEAPRPKR